MMPKGSYGVCQIINDPDPDCCFPPGARLQGLVPMLLQGSFTPGTTLRFIGRRYLVLGAAGSRQTLAARR